MAEPGGAGDGGADADALAMQLYRAVAAGDGAAVAGLLPAARAAAEGRLALAARVEAWAAQDALARGDVREAARCVRAALARARAAGDEAGLAALGPLQQRIFAARAAAAGPPGGAAADTPAGRAVEAFDRGAPEARALALEAREAGRRAGDAKEEVVALLALARVPGEAARWVREAAAVADASGDMNLVTAVAKAAKAAGVELDAFVF